MDKDDAIIKPVKGKNAPDLGAVAVVVSVEADLLYLCKIMDLTADNSRSLYMSRLYFENKSDYPGISVTGPILGAPYAVMLLESLIAWGAEKIIFMGWCGAISKKVGTADIVLASSAIADEGTSKHYFQNENIARPSVDIMEKTKNILKENDLSYHEGIIWTTDAIYRETPEKVKYYQEKNVLGVEMELSALFTVGRFRGVDVGGILVVSDELSALKWRPGFREKRFHQSRIDVLKAVKKLCKIL